MKATALILSTLLFIFAVKEAEGSIRNYVNASATGGNSKVDVKINNNFNSGSSTGTSSVRGENTTQVDINQEGTGTSSVTINGEEYKVEGTGSLHIDEKMSVSPTDTPSGSESGTVTPAENQSADEEINNVEKNRSFVQRIIEELRENLRAIFASLF